MTRKKLTGSAAAMLVLIIATILLVPGMFHATAQEQPLQAPAVQQAKAVQETQYAKRQLRAAWISTAWNIDWPSRKGLPSEQQKQEFIQILDDVKQMGMNAVVVQVRPMADAFYPSEYAPWSEYLTGTQGKSPGYDPLAFMVEEAHKRNLEFHAWFNPYRISTQSSLDKLSANHPARQHPDWVVTYGGRLYFNPGLPEVKQYITNSVLEVVRNYDIDSVHLDDYFYPYPVSGEEFPDDAAFRTYGNGFGSKADWRRDNVNQLVKDLSHEIKSAKTYVKFGISPFGVWRNKSSDPNGSDTRALSSYEAQFADTRKWVQEEWLDYIAPQVYWSFDFSAAQYNKVTDWWIEQTQGKNVHLYTGHAAYKIANDTASWNNPDEIPNQIKYNTERFNQVKGSVFFSYKDLKSNRLGIRDRLIQDSYRYPALVPAMPWIDRQSPASPALISAVNAESAVNLTWKDSENSGASYYAVYRFAGNQPGSIENAVNLIGTVRKTRQGTYSFKDTENLPGGTYTYVITALSRTHNESAPSNAVSVLK